MSRSWVLRFTRSLTIHDARGEVVSGAHLRDYKEWDVRSCIFQLRP